MTLTRRRFAFWIGFGLFSLAERLRVYGLDELAAATMRGADATATVAKNGVPQHWRAADNGTWRWYERESLIDGKWQLSGITTPIHLETGVAYDGQTGYLDESLVPAAVRRSKRESGSEVAVEEEPGVDAHPGEPDPSRRARHGRPPSQWLRSLNADEIRIWLKTIDVPEADVSGMTFWEHLTRDHSFDPVKIDGLTIDEQAKLHAAAHYGY